MSTEVILLNPYGTDCTQFVNGTGLASLQLLKGTVMAPGDTLYTIGAPYSLTTSSAANIATLKGLLDTRIRHNYSIGVASKVFGYSMGGQGADAWINDNAANPPVPSNMLSFLLIGNADRKFGGFAYGCEPMAATGYIGGLPSSVPWPYVDLARQYDGVADFPTAPAIRQALAQIELAAGSFNAFGGALGAVLTIMGNADWTLAASNAVNGILWVHNFYTNLTVDDEDILWHTDSNGAKYGIKPTYPVPQLGLSTWFPSLDLKYRNQIELSFDRVFGAMPIPSQDMPTSDAAQVNPVTAVIPPQGTLAQVAGMLAELSLSRIADYRFTAAQEVLSKLMGEWRSDVAQARSDLLQLRIQLTAIQHSYPTDGKVARCVEYVDALSV